MFRSPSVAATLTAASLVLSLSCSRKPAPASERFLLLPLENETSEAKWDWASAVSSPVLEYDLNGATHVTTLRGDSISSAAGSGVNRVLQGYFAIDRDRLSIHASVEDPITVKTLKIVVREGPIDAGFVPLLNAVARELTPQSRAFSTRDSSALEHYGKGLLAPDNATKVRDLRAAVEQDPKFSTAYQSLAGILLAQGDKADAANVASQGAQTAGNSLDRAELVYMAAAARSDLSGREKALTEIARQSPDNIGVLELLGQAHALQRKYREAIQNYEAIIRLNPRNAAAYNVTGYLYAYLHDLPHADNSLREYQRLSSPGDPNPVDSLGEVHFLLGDFSKAEQFFRAAHEKNPSATAGRELRKAAQARLMTGDLPGADSIFGEYLVFIRSAGAGTIEMQRAQWEFLSGRRDQAIARLQPLLIVDSGDIGSLAASQLAAWRLQAGDRAQALELATRAKAHAITPVGRNLSAVCEFLAAPERQASPVPLLNGLALVLAGDFSSAVPVFEQMLRESSPASDGEVRTLLAWCYSRTNRVADTKPLVDLYPLLFPDPDAIFSSLTFPRFLELRAAVAEADRNTAEAQRLTQLYRKYTGDHNQI